MTARLHDDVKLEVIPIVKTSYRAAYCGHDDCAPPGGFSHLHVATKRRVVVATVYNYDQARDWITFEANRQKSQEQLWKEWRASERRVSR